MLPLTRDRNFGHSPDEDDVTNHRGCGRDGDKSYSDGDKPLLLHPEEEVHEEQEEEELLDTELPVQAGHVILWGGRTLHCGGPSHAEAPEARISLAVAFSVPIGDQEASGDDEAEWVRVGAFRGWSSAFRENKQSDCLADDAIAGNPVGRDGGGGDYFSDDGADASDEDIHDGETDNNTSCDGNVSGWHLEKEIAAAPLDVRIRCIAMQLEFYSDVQPVPHHIQKMIDNM